MDRDTQRSMPALPVLGAAILCLWFATWVSHTLAQSSPIGDTTARRILPEDSRSTGTMVLSGLHRVSEISPAAAASVVSTENRFSHRRQIGVEVPEDWQEGDPIDVDARLASVVDAEVAVVYYDEHDPDRENTIIAAGYEYPVSPDGERRPWLIVKRRNATVARCDFVIDAGEGNRDDLMNLREVVAIDRRYIYFAAVSPEGDELLAAAEYSFSPNPSAIRSKR